MNQDDSDGEVLAEGLPEDGDTTGENASHSSNVEKCPTCGRPTDDIESLDEVSLVARLRVELLRDLARGFVHGTITHQEKAIIRGLLRDNNSKVPSPREPEFERDDTIPQREDRSPLPSDQGYPTGDYPDTDGG